MSERPPLAHLYESGARGWMELLDWSYPAEFSRAADEHVAVRREAGLFDFSFMSHVAVRGRDALALVQRVTTNDAARLAPGAAMYSPLCDDAGGLVDDCTVIRTGPGDYLVTTGLASSVAWLGCHGADLDVAVEDRSSMVAVIALQGPAAGERLVEVGVPDVAGLPYFRAIETSCAGASVLLVRLGYSGELGYEVFVDVGAAGDVWRALARRARMCGGRALDSLRLEAGYLMTRVDFDRGVRPAAAGLGRFVRFEKGDFVGRAALVAASPSPVQMTGLRMDGDTVPRRGAGVHDGDGKRVGRVTSACASPTLGGVLAFAYVTPAGAGAFHVEGVPGGARAIALPFYDLGRQRVHAACRVATGAA